MIPEISCQVCSNSKLILYLNLKNLSQESLLFRPTLQDWVIDNKMIISSISTIDPYVTCISYQQEIKHTLTIEIPANLQPGQILKNWLRFPGIQEEAIPLNLIIITPSNRFRKNVNFSVSLSINLPINPQNSQIDTTFSLMSGILDLDKIPLRWLVAELCIKLCQIGENYSQSSQGNQLLNQLKSSDLFKNGVTVFSSEKIPQWIIETIHIIQKTLPCEAGESSLLYIWESWLFSLDKIHHTVPKLLVNDCINKMELFPDKWFSNLILGLAKLSPQIEKKLTTFLISNKTQLTPNSQSNINFINLLSVLDSIPVRWLVAEILVKIAYLGEKSIKTEEEKNLVSHLSSTSFFHQGILAFTAAQVPRWIDISYSAINAYYSSLGLASNNHGLLYFAETWLWNLVPNSLETKSITQNIDLDIFIKELGMDEKRWFIALLFGLKQLCPRIDSTLQKIAQQTENLSNETSAFTSYQNDVIQESGSIQR
ncbi:MAG: hypothetical protein AB4062_02680 [Crocosphaera sp.]